MRLRGREGGREGERERERGTVALLKLVASSTPLCLDRGRERERERERDLLGTVSIKPP